MMSTVDISFGDESHSLDAAVCRDALNQGALAVHCNCVAGLLIPQHLSNILRHKPRLTVSHNDANLSHTEGMNDLCQRQSKIDPLYRLIGN